MSHGHLPKITCSPIYWISPKWSYISKRLALYCHGKEMAFWISLQLHILCASALC